MSKKRRAGLQPEPPPGVAAVMSDPILLTPDELEILLLARSGPLSDPDPAVRQVCLNLQARRLLQRAGTEAFVNGWRGSPHAFVLAQDGWNRLKAERRTTQTRRRG
jgi:hypothetical protein